MSRVSQDHLVIDPLFSVGEDRVPETRRMETMDFGTKLDESGINLDFDFDYNVLISEVDDTLSELLNSNFYELKSKTVPANTHT